MSEKVYKKKILFQLEEDPLLVLEDLLLAPDLFPLVKLDALLGQEEDLLLAHEEDLLLVHEEDLLLPQAENCQMQKEGLLVQGENFFLYRKWICFLYKKKTVLFYT